MDEFNVKGEKEMKVFKIIFIVLILFTTNPAWSLSPIEQSYTETLANGGPSSVRSVASSISKVQGLDTEVYDVAAEVLFRDYQKPNLSNTDIDALAWITKALLASDDSRYLSVLEEVNLNSPYPKLQKYANSIYSKLSKSALNSSPSYEKGMVELANYKAKPSQQSNLNNTAVNQGNLPISEVKVGMSSAYVYSLCGSPTSEYSHITGKAFNPFNFSGKGNTRIVALYKGQGSVVFENTSAYTAGKRVVEVILDTYESGYR